MGATDPDGAQPARNQASPPPVPRNEVFVTCYCDCVRYRGNVHSERTVIIRLGPDQHTGGTIVNRLCREACRGLSGRDEEGDYVRCDFDRWEIDRAHSEKIEAPGWDECVAERLLFAAYFEACLAYVPACIGICTEAPWSSSCWGCILMGPPSEHWLCTTAHEAYLDLMECLYSHM